MTNLDILCSDHLTFQMKLLKTKTSKEKKDILRGPSRMFENISWPNNVCLKYFIASAKNLSVPPSYLFNVQSLKVANSGIIV